MDAYQHPHPYLRPPLPPPPMADPPHPNYHQPPPPSQTPWYPPQFHYHPHNTHSSPPPQWPPPPPPQQPPPYSGHLPPPPYHTPPPPYPPHHYPPPHRSHMPHPQPYSQEWGNPNWPHHQGWEYSDRSFGPNNEEDWAARAKAWAASKTATESPYPQSQYTPIGRHEEPGYYHDQYPLPVDPPHYSDNQQPLVQASSYQQLPGPVGPVVHSQESSAAFIGSESSSSYFPDRRPSYTVRDGSLAQESFPTIPSVHQQEVPSSYSSVTGKVGGTNENEQLYISFPSAQDGHHVQQQPPYYSYGKLSGPASDLSDQPLDFVPRYSRDHDPPHMHSTYAHPDPVGPIDGIDPIHAWTSPPAPGVAYPPPPLQHDSIIPVPSPVSGHGAPVFGRVPGPNFQPSLPPFGAGTNLHPTTAFPGDAYGVSTIQERPKKASVPNWLREEIIKKKTVIANTARENPQDETQFIGEESVKKSLGEGDQSDRKKSDSSRSTEDEDDDDDEDYVEATKVAAINQEIKRVLTEVLLKVTDELFDEIATKVLSENEPSVEVEPDSDAPNRKKSSTSAVPTPKASAQVLIPVKSKEPETEDGGKSTPSSPGDVLGLGSYASDDDDDGEDDQTQTSSKNDASLGHSNPKSLLEGVHEALENGTSQAEVQEQNGGKKPIESDVSITTLNGVKHKSGDLVCDSRENHVAREVEHGNGGSIEAKTNINGGRMLDKDSLSEKTVIHDSNGKETITKSEKNRKHESRRSSDVEVENSKVKVDRRTEDKHRKNEKMDDRNNLNERTREREKSKESDARKSQRDVREDGKETEGVKRSTGKEDHKNEKGDRSQDKQSDSGRHKRRRSSSRGRNSKDNSVASHANASNDEASDESKRKHHSKRRNLSPSPTWSRKRRVSRSPHSKHSQRRHSPYSSLESSRGRR